MEEAYTPHTRKLKRLDLMVGNFFDEWLFGDVSKAKDTPRSDGKLLYHGMDHTFDSHKGVVAVTNKLALLEGVSEGVREVLVATAMLHDTGYAFQYQHNEPVGASIASSMLRYMGYNEGFISKVRELIEITDTRKTPENLLQFIIRDADSDNLGRDDFFEQSENLRKELNIEDLEAWHAGQIKFLEGHRYFTESQKKLRGVGKSVHYSRLLQEELRNAN